MLCISIIQDNIICYCKLNTTLKFYVKRSALENHESASKIII